MWRLTTTASLSLRTTTHSSGSLVLAVSSWCGSDAAHRCNRPDRVQRWTTAARPHATARWRQPAHLVDDALELAVVMCPGLGVGPNVHRACPNFLGADAGIVDRGLAIHARRLWGVGIERMARNDAHAIVFPFRRPFAVGFGV